MILSIPVKAQEEFINLCKEVETSDTEKSFELSRTRAEGYSKAMQMILGVSVWAAIVREADLSFEEDIFTCAGIPMFYKNLVPQP